MESKVKMAYAHTKDEDKLGMGLLSRDESIVWQEFQRGKNTSTIAEDHTADGWNPAYVSRVLNRARKKIAKALKERLL